MVTAAIAARAMSVPLTPTLAGSAYCRWLGSGLRTASLARLDLPDEACYKRETTI
jgi:hypothetical protein